MGHENSAKYGEDHCPALGLRILGYGGAPRPHRSIEIETNKSNALSTNQPIADQINIMPLCKSLLHNINDMID
jgi:hypothetical protein